MADNLTIKINGDIKDYKKKTKEVGGVAKKLDVGLQKLAKGTAVAFAGLTTGIVLAVREAAKIETITTQFEVLTGSAEEASKIVKDLQEFSASTPFQFEGIAKTAQQLLGFGFVADEIPEKLQQIGDVASAIGKPIEEVGFIFGQISAAGKLTGERLLQLQERAIPIGPAIAKTMGVAETAVKDLVSAGKVDFATFETAFQSLSAEGGFAFGGMIKQSKTLEGVLSTVGDNVKLFAAQIGKELLPAAKKMAEGFLDILKSLRESDNFIITAVRFWGKIIAESFETGTEKTKKSLGEVTSELDEVDAGIKRVEKSIEENKDNSIYNSFIGKATQDMEEYGELLARKTELEKQQKELSSELDKQQLDKKRERAQEEAQIAREKRELLEEERLAARTEQEALDEEAEAERREREKESVTMHEEAIKKIQKDKIMNVNEAKRSNARDDLKAEVKENNIRMKEKQRHGKAIATSQAFFRRQEVQGAGMALDNLATLGASGNKTLGKIAQKAQIAKAIMNTAEGISKALTFGPIIGPILAATQAAAGFVQVDVIRNQKFREGGVFQGGIPGVDSIPATVQRNEIIAPTRSFDEVIGSVRAKREADKLTGGELSGSQVELIVSYDSPEASQIVTVGQVEDGALGISQDGLREAS